MIREASAAAVASAERERTLDAVMASTVQAAHAAVAKTPSLLAILREAGVVDSGGQASPAHGGRACVPYRRRRDHAAADRGEGDAGRRDGGRHQRGPARSAARRRDARRGLRVRDDVHGRRHPGQAPRRRRDPVHYESIGESVLVAGDARAIKVHIHNERPDQVLAYALGLGTLSKITIENLDTQTEDVRETRAAAFATEAGEDGTRRKRRPQQARRERSAWLPSAGNEATNGATPFPSPNAIPLAVVAVAAGEGLAAILRDFGVHKVVYGGQTQNPSTGELLEAVKAVDAREVLLLPNNPNIVLAARQVAAMTDRPVAVVATRRGGLCRAAGAGSGQGRGRQRAGDDHRGTRCPDGLGDRGRPRRDRERQEGQAGPDHRP